LEILDTVDNREIRGDNGEEIMRFFGGEGVGSLGGRKARARLSERARESAGEESRGGPIVVRPSAHPRVRKQLVSEEARAMEEGCWRRSMSGALEGDGFDVGRGRDKKLV
jgi:hypothetical protein